MTALRTSYVVMSRRGPPYHDSGSWTEHDKLADAKALAKQVHGQVFRKTEVDGRVTLKSVNARTA